MKMEEVHSGIALTKEMTSHPLAASKSNINNSRFLYFEKRCIIKKWSQMNIKGSVVNPQNIFPRFTSGLQKFSKYLGTTSKSQAPAR